jgi:hypothetical protein
MKPTPAEDIGLDTAPVADDAAAALQPRDEAGRCGFQIGWDHARHGLVPAAELLIDGTPVGQGWHAGKAVFGRRRLPTTPALRWWLRLRTEAWRTSLPFDGATVTPKWLARLAATHCPVLRQPLGGAPGADSAPVTVCLDPEAGYRAGNLVVLSQRAAAEIDRLDRRSALRLAATAQVAGGTVSPRLSAEQAARLAVLLSHRKVLPFCEAARLPLHLLPPPQVQPANPVQALQAWLTRQFATPGWSARLRGLADALPADARGQADAALRHDFNLFIGALAPRLLGANTGIDGLVPDTVLEDAWADERVQRRWQRFAAALGEDRSTLLLGLITSRALARAGSAPRNSGRHGAGRGALRGRPTPGADVQRGARAVGRPTPRPSVASLPVQAPRP